jgi:hypothetical protein
MKLINSGMLTQLQDVIKTCKTTDTLERGVIERSLNLLSKIFRQPAAVAEIAKSKHTVFKLFLFMNKTYAGELQMNALRSLHPLCRSPNFKSKCLDEHKIPEAMLTTYIKESKLLFSESLTPGKEDWVQYQNACGSITAFIDCFTDKLIDYQDLIIPLIKVAKDKTDGVRKNSAVLLAKLAKDEENSKHMRANHGYEVIMSLRS